jgi:hypothetical protein
MVAKRHIFSFSGCDYFVMKKDLSFFIGERSLFSHKFLADIVVRVLSILQAK